MTLKSLPIIIVPLLITLAGAAMLFRRGLIDDFLDGVRDGMLSCVKLAPTLVALMTAVAVFNASGAAEAISGLAAPLLSKLGVPAELTPLLLVRPVSGSASNALLDTMLATYGPDGFIGRCASVICGSSDTVVYITAVYLGGAGIKKSGLILPAALLTMLFTIFFGCLVVRLYFGNM